MDTHLPNYIRRSLKKFTRNFGFEVIRFTPQASNNARLKHFLSYYKFNLVFDVGANVGQYASNLREIGYKGRIISFEPGSSAHSILKSNAEKDLNWDIAPRIAIGDQDQEIEINISENTLCTSFLDLTDDFLESFPGSSYSSTEKVQLARLDNIEGTFFNKENDKILLKIDTQGYEKQVLEGAKGILPHILGVQLELSINQLYKEEILYDAMINYLKQLGYILYAVIPGYTDKRNGKMLQMDGLFLRDELL
jgi:FkbM family methyltransferase